MQSWSTEKGWRGKTNVTYSVARSCDLVRTVLYTWSYTDCLNEERVNWERRLFLSCCPGKLVLLAVVKIADPLWARSKIRPSFRLILGAQRHGCAYLWDTVHVTVVEHLLWCVLPCNLSRNTIWKTCCCCLHSLHLLTNLNFRATHKMP